MGNLEITMKVPSSYLPQDFSAFCYINGFDPSKLVMFCLAFDIKDHLSEGFELFKRFNNLLSDNHLQFFCKE